MSRQSGDLSTYGELQSTISRAATRFHLASDTHRRDRTKETLTAKIQAGRNLIKTTERLEDFIADHGGRDAFFEDMRDEDEADQDRI